MSEKIIKFPSKSNELTFIKGMTLCLNQLAVECLDEGYVMAAHMLKATAGILKNGPLNEEA